MCYNLLFIDSSLIKVTSNLHGCPPEKKIHVLCFQGNPTRFHVAMHLFSNTSQMMRKCVKNKKVAHKVVAEYVTDVLIVLLIVLLSKTWLKWLLVREMKTYSKSRIELQNLPILKKMLEISGQFLSS